MGLKLRWPSSAQHNCHNTMHRTNLIVFCSFCCAAACLRCVVEILLLCTTGLPYETTWRSVNKDRIYIFKDTTNEDAQFQRCIITYGHSAAVLSTCFIRKHRNVQRTWQRIPLCLVAIEGKALFPCVSKTHRLYCSGMPMKAYLAKHESNDNNTAYICDRLGPKDKPHAYCMTKLITHTNNEVSESMWKTEVDRLCQRIQSSQENTKNIYLWITLRANRRRWDGRG